MSIPRVCFLGIVLVLLCLLTAPRQCEAQQGRDRNAPMTFEDALQQLKLHQERMRASGLLRPGNAPESKCHEKKAAHAIVLIHGLGDSPYFMHAIGDRFYRLGFNVVYVLLAGHGLEKPAKKMKSVRLQEWLEEVGLNVRLAHGLGDRVSIGGLSTGGALSLHKALYDPRSINGGVFLFSAALQIKPLQEWVLQQHNAAIAANIIDEKKLLAYHVRSDIKHLVSDEQIAPDDYGIGDNPYRYCVRFMNGAEQLVQLIRKIDEQYPGGRKRYTDLMQPVFIAHSEADNTAAIEAVQEVYDNHPNPRKCFFRIAKAPHNVPHASVVLKEPVGDPVTGRPIVNPKTRELIEDANPLFDARMDDVERFVRQHLPETALSGATHGEPRGVPRPPGRSVSPIAADPSGSHRATLLSDRRPSGRH